MSSYRQSKTHRNGKWQDKVSKMKTGEFLYVDNNMDAISVYTAAQRNGMILSRTKEGKRIRCLVTYSPND